MGRCYEFGLDVVEGCAEPMHAAEDGCRCPSCGAACGGRFAGCRDVWAGGSQPVTLVRPQASLGVRAAAGVERGQPSDDPITHVHEELETLRAAVARQEALLVELARRGGEQAAETAAERAREPTGRVRDLLGRAVRSGSRRPGWAGDQSPRPAG